MKKTRSVRGRGFSLIEVLFVVILIGIILTVLVIILNSKQKELRDVKRINDIQSLKQAMEVVKNETGSYDRAYCDLTFVSQCYKKEDSELPRVLPILPNLNDPKFLGNACNSTAACKSGCNYSFTKLEAAEYEVLFYLEKGVDGYSQKGCYRLNEQGIIKL